MNRSHPPRPSTRPDAMVHGGGTVAESVFIARLGAGGDPFLTRAAHGVAGDAREGPRWRRL